MEINWNDLIKNKFKENTTKDGVYCDVGACVGLFTSFFKELGIVYSFELNVNNFNEIKHLSSEKCICENIAISDDIGLVPIYANNTLSSNFTSNIIGHDVNYTQLIKIGTIKSISLDKYFKEIHVDYLKIDVEGAELKVIKGGINTIKNSKLTIIECHYDEDWYEINKILKENNLNFKNLVDDSYVTYGSFDSKPGLTSVGRPHQMYLKN